MRGPSFFRVATPCRDGEIAFGQKGVCGGHKVRYTTIVMKDKDDGSLQDWADATYGAGLVRVSSALTLTAG